jgi:hypothetical protein
MAPQEAVTIDHAEALRLIDEQIGEHVYFGLFVMRAASASGDEERIPLIHSSGRLGNPLEPKPPRLETDVGYYGFGREAFDSFPLPPMVGETQLRDNGVDFLISDTVRIRVAWRGSKEVGDRHPDAGELRRVKMAGLSSALSSKDPFLERFLAKARLAPAKVLQLSPTPMMVGLGDVPKRIWTLRVSVEPTGDSPFEAEVERAWVLEDEIERRIERGEFITGVPTSPAEVQVAYDPSDHEQVIAYPFDDSGRERTIKIQAMIVGPTVEDDEKPLPPG